MKRAKIILTIGVMFCLMLCLIHGGKVFAYNPAEGNITASFGPFVGKTNYIGSDSGARSVFLGGASLIANGDISERGSLEIAMIHMNKLFFRQKDGMVIGEETQVMHITMGYRYWLASHYSLALAFYSAYAMGSPKIVHSDFPTGNEIDTSARDTVEYGADFSMQAELWNRNRSSVLLDLRYAMSFTNKDSESGDHYGAMVLYKYLIQEKYPSRNKVTALSPKAE